MYKIQNPQVLATIRMMQQYEDLCEGMVFTDVTAIDENIAEFRSQYLDNPNFNMHAFLNDVTGNMTFVSTNTENSVVVFWDEIEAGEKAIVIVSANSLGELTESFAATEKLPAVKNVRPVGHDDF